MSIKSFIKYNVLLFVFVAFAACSLNKETEESQKRDMQTVVTATEKAKLPADSEYVKNIRYRDDVWLGNSSFRNERGDALPQKFENADGITVVSERPVALLELAELIRKMTGITVRIDGDLIEDAEEDAEENMPDDVDMLADWAKPGAMIVSYSGPLSGLMEDISSRFNVWWKYKNSEILIFKYETKTFTVYALPTERDYNQSLSSDANSTSKVGQALTTTLDNKTEIKTWENIDESIKNILESDEDSKYTADKASGMVTVTASPTQMRKIAEYVTELNKNLSRQVAVSVKVLKLTISDTERFNLDPLISLDNIFSQKFGIQGALKGASNTALTDYTGVTWGVPGTSTTATDVPGIAFRIFDSTSNPTKHLNGSSMVIDALSTQGTVSVMTNTSVTTMNNRPAPVSINTSQAYVKEVTRTRDTESQEVTVSMTTDEIITGFNLAVLPRILEHGRLILSMSIALSEKDSMETTSFEGNQVTLPTVSTRSFTQEIAMKSGTTLVMAGFENVGNSVTKTGVGDVDFSLLGTGKSTVRERSLLVLIVTPEVLKSPLSPEDRVDD